MADVGNGAGFRGGEMGGGAEGRPYRSLKMALLGFGWRGGGIDDRIPVF